MNDFTITRNQAGRLLFTSKNNSTIKEIVPIRAFPITAPDQYISLTDHNGHELLLIEHLTELPYEYRHLIEDELKCREFMPEIMQINSVSSFATPSIWQIKTDRGNTELILKSEDHIRRLSHTSLLITDAHGVSYLMREIEKLDSHSRKLLDRFL